MNIKLLEKLAKLQGDKITKQLSDFANKQIEKIKKSSSNDQIYYELELLDQYSFRVPKKALKAVKLIIGAQEPLKPTKKRIKGFGTIVIGKTYEELIVKCIEIMDKIRYMETDLIFPLLLKLAQHEGGSIKNEANRVLTNLSQYNLFVLKKLGVGAQKYLIKKITGWSSIKLKENFNAILEISSQLLSPSFEGQSWPEYNKVTFHSGPMPITPELKNIRSNTIALLTSLYELSKDLEQKKRILNVSQEASHTPHQGGYKEDMEEMVLGNTNQLVKFYIEIAKHSDISILKVIEEQSAWFRRRFKGKSLKGIKVLERIIGGNRDYEFFKIFVGHDLEERYNLGWKEAEKLRRGKISKFVKAINDSNKADWEKRILSISEQYLLDQSMSFIYFNMFLTELGKDQTDFALELINKHDTRLKFFLVYLLQGVWQSNQRLLKEILKSWLVENRHIEVVSIIFGNVGEIDLALLNETFSKAKKAKNTQALNNVIYSIFRVPKQAKDLKGLFVEIVKELTKYKDGCNWISHVWYHEEKPLLDELTAKDIDVILDNLLSMPTFNHYLEQVLDFIAEKYPKKLVAFFAKRVEKKTSIKRGEDRYEDIPFRVSRLDEYIKKNEDLVVSEIFKWFKKGKTWPWEWKASHLLQALFPSFPKSLQKILINLIKEKNKDWIHPILSILRAYGEVIPYDVCKEFIKTYGDQEEYKKEMFIVLSQTGVVSGEYGFMEAYVQKKKDIQEWEKERGENISSFVKDYEKYIDGQIAYEKKKADESIELRKRGIH